MTDFVSLHEVILPMLTPLLPTAFPFSPRTPRFLHTDAFLDARMALLETYLRQAVEAAQGNLPPDLSTFLGLPPGGVTFEPLKAPTAPAIASAEWEFPHKSINWVREIGQGGFGTVFEVSAAGQS